MDENDKANILYRIGKIIERKISNEYREEYLRDGGIRLTITALILKLGPMLQSAIVEKTGWSKSRVSITIASMKEAGLAVKIAKGRENIVGLEEKIVLLLTGEISKEEIAGLEITENNINTALVMLSMLSKESRAHDTEETDKRIIAGGNDMEESIILALRAEDVAVRLMELLTLRDEVDDIRKNGSGLRQALGDKKVENEKLALRVSEMEADAASFSEQKLKMEGKILQAEENGKAELEKITGEFEGKITNLRQELDAANQEKAKAVSDAEEANRKLDAAEIIFSESKGMRERIHVAERERDEALSVAKAATDESNRKAISLKEELDKIKIQMQEQNEIIRRSSAEFQKLQAENKDLEKKLEQLRTDKTTIANNLLERMAEIAGLNEEIARLKKEQEAAKQNDGDKPPEKLQIEGSEETPDEKIIKGQKNDLEEIISLLENRANRNKATAKELVVLALLKEGELTRSELAAKTGIDSAIKNVISRLARDGWISIGEDKKIKPCIDKILEDGVSLSLEERIINLLKENGGEMKHVEISRILGEANSNIHVKTKQMEGAGVVKKVPGEKGILITLVQTEEFSGVEKSVAPAPPAPDESKESGKPSEEELGEPADKKRRDASPEAIAYEIERLTKTIDHLVPNKGKSDKEYNDSCFFYIKGSLSKDFSEKALLEFGKKFHNKDDPKAIGNIWENGRLTGLLANSFFLELGNGEETARQEKFGSLHAIAVNAVKSAQTENDGADGAMEEKLMQIARRVIKAMPNNGVAKSATTEYLAGVLKTTAEMIDKAMALHYKTGMRPKIDIENNPGGFKIYCLR